ncbi:hypothetical protein [Paracoccus beibuensis]|uniref:hypothetical protein n=1 Tax=Paracoccus beibuensis TaxID=547602 RepID=UPI00223FFFDE|nr:hypothetical protein [Paracoccus beibuensis]
MPGLAARFRSSDSTPEERVAAAADLPDEAVVSLMELDNAGASSETSAKCLNVLFDEVHPVVHAPDPSERQ